MRRYKIRTSKEREEKMERRSSERKLKQKKKERRIKQRECTGRSNRGLV